MSPPSSTSERRLMIVRGSSSSLIDVEVYIRTLGHVENLEKFSSMPLGLMNSRTRRRLKLSSTKEKNAKKSSVKSAVINSVSAVIFIVLFFF